MAGAVSGSPLARRAPTTSPGGVILSVLVPHTTAEFSGQQFKEKSFGRRDDNGSTG
jgi:hypothetical protein